MLGNTQEATVRCYRILELDPSSGKLSSFTTTSPATDDLSKPLSLSLSLSKLNHPSTFLQQLVSLITKHDIVEATGNIVILQQRPSYHQLPSSPPETATSSSALPSGPRNHHDFTAAQVTPSLATTQMHPPKVAEAPPALTKTHLLNQGYRRDGSHQSHRIGVGRVFQTAIWATALCYLAGVWFETSPRL